MNIINQIKPVMRRLTPAEMAAAELADAELHRLEAYSAMEYATNSVNVCNDRIKRLRKFLAESEKTA